MTNESNPTQAPPPGVRTPRVAAVIVTWNRRDMVAAVLEALGKQTFPLDALDVFVIDNNSSDGTLEHLEERFSPEHIFDNDTDRAERPAFVARDRSVRNTLGLRSLNIVRNTANLGGCGGFNTGFAAVEHALGAAGAASAPDYVWLVDDDVDLEPDLAEQLTRVAEADHSIGLVGSRTVDLHDRETTIETTIYYHPTLGVMGDEPEAGDERLDAHRAWAKPLGGPKYGNGYAGTREVDIVSACSMLARWTDVAEVGFWDARYFIYCDDADWCCRFRDAGKRVVLNLDAVVYHTPWHHKLTPARIYYAERNLVWLNEKAQDGASLRRTLGARFKHMLRESTKAALCRRAFHAEVYRHAAHDAVTNRGGTLGIKQAAPIQTLSALRGKRVALVILSEEAEEAADALRAHCETLPVSERPAFLELSRNTVPGRAEDAPGRIVYSERLRSRVLRRLQLALKRPQVVVVFDHQCDVPFVCGVQTLHVGLKNVEEGVPERLGVLDQVRFLSRLIGTMSKCRRYTRTAQRRAHKGRYGSV